MLLIITSAYGVNALHMVHLIRSYASCCICSPKFMRTGDWHIANIVPSRLCKFKLDPELPNISVCKP